jgi:phosphate transport system substrate-binding protein
MLKPIPGRWLTRWPGILGATAVLAACSAASVHAEDIRIGGTGAALGTMQLLAEAYAKSHPNSKIVVLPSLGSGGGVKAVLSGVLQIGLSARPLTEDEVKAGAVGVEYGRTPLVFATSATTKIGDLTTQNLVDIYSGKAEQWPDGTKIRLVLRPIGDSDSELIKNLSPTMRDATHAAEQRRGMSFAITDQDAATNIEKTPGALGPSTLALILSENRQLKALTLNGIAPSAKSIADGTYPLFKQLLLVTGPKTLPAARDFVTFVRSAAGREILLQTGHWVN